jgi:hypothetical protein
MKLFATLKHEFRLMLPPTIFFFIAFILIAVTQRLILREYGVPLTGFAQAFIGALLIGKVILLTDKLSFINKYPNRPLIYNITWKSSIYFIAALFFRYIEHIIPLLRQHQDFSLANQHLVEEIVWPHFWLVHMWLVVLFLTYCTLSELVRVIGKEEVMCIFFGNNQPNEYQLIETHDE